MSDHYRTLEIDKNASQSEIKAAYRKLAKKYHPDKNKSENAARIFQEINKAQEVLSNSERRVEYDRSSDRQTTTEEFRQGPGTFENPLKYSKSTIKKGKIFGLILLMAVIIIPLLLIRYSSKYNYDKGLEFYDQGDLSKALVYFDMAIMEFGARKKEASFKAIDICYKKGYVSQGIAFAQKGADYISKKDLKGKFCYLEGLGWEMLDQFSQADLSYNKAIEYGYTTDSVYIHLGMMHGFELSQYDKAIGYFDYLIEVSGLNEYLLQRGIIYQKSGRTKEAILDLRNYIQNSPDNGMGYFFLGISLIESGKQEEACVAFIMAASKGLEESEAYLRIYCLERTKQIW